MTESQWLASTEPAALLAYLRAEDGRPLRQREPLLTERKLRLFACACCRQVWHLLTDPRSRNAVEVAEQYADGLVTLQELSDADDGATIVVAEVEGTADANTGIFAAQWVADIHIAEFLPTLLNAIRVTPASDASRSDLLRATFNPFAAPLPDDCRTPLVLGLAEGAYEELVDLRCQKCIGTGSKYPGASYHHYDRPSKADDCAACGGSGRSACGTLDPDRLAVLSDVLEEAGAPGPLLAALRDPVPRYRGFWPIDMLTGRG